jgi:hypothetical protein
MLTIAAALIIALPVTFGQEPVPIISMSANVWERPNPVGINQTIFIQGLIWPPPSYAFNHTWTIARVETVVNKPFGAFNVLSPIVAKEQLQ